MPTSNPKDKKAAKIDPCGPTEQKNKFKVRQYQHTPVFGYPTIDAVELPRLKLLFHVRKDHHGVERLYSADHADLFISNERNELSSKMLAGTL